MANQDTKNLNPFVVFKTAVARPEVPTVSDVDPQEVLQQKDRVKIIDVRRAEEFVGEFGHIDGSELVTLDTLPQYFERLPKDQTIVFVCRSGGRSAQATHYAFENGLKHTFNMKGGMMLWDKLGLPAKDKNP